jgi:subtilisin family serine protease
VRHIYRTLAAASLGAAVVSASLAGCADEVLNPLPYDDATGGATPTSSSAVGANGGEGPEPSRGDPSNFPGTCVESCQEACDALDSCGADSSPLFPIDSESCLQRCELQQNSGGGFWDDISGNFKCCASQGSCDLVKHCGGWLDHPDAKNSCELMCSCFSGGGSLSELNEGHVAPKGYRWATETVWMELDDVSVELKGISGVTATRTGKLAQIKHRGSDAGTVSALRSVGKLLPTFRDGLGRLSAATGRVVVRATTGAHRATVAMVASHLSMTKPRAHKTGQGLRVIDAIDPWDAVDAVQRLVGEGLEAELDMIRMHEWRYSPNDPLFADQWHLLNLAQGRSTFSVDARVAEAWDVTLGDAEVLISVFDDGVNLNHADFAGKLEPALRYPNDWETKLSTGFGSHGTSVAGVAGALADDAVGGAGVCPGCRVIPTLLAETNSMGQFPINDMQIADGFVTQVDAGAWVINNSWGIGQGNPSFYESTLPLPGLAMVVANAFDYAENSGRNGLGTVILYASGNDNEHDTDGYNDYATTVSVAAVGDLGLKAYYSSSSASVTVAAPSSGALSGITTSSSDGGHTANFGGTSSACPLAAGVVGLIFSANKTLTAAQARQILEDSATPIDPVWGGYNNGHSNFYGHGMVNAAVAVQMAQGCVDPTQCPAPSDDCGNNCGTRAQCDQCRVTADCASGFVCQALPSLGQMVCVEQKGTSACPSGTNLMNGYCIPTAQTCNVCGGQEECNGRDDDCNGEIDDGVCNNGALCFFDAACPTGQVCAGTRCITACIGDSDCGEDGQCIEVKNMYGGHSPAIKGCASNQTGGCGLGCSVLVSSVDDATMAQYVACMQDGQASCNDVFDCFQYLPISM